VSFFFPAIPLFSCFKVLVYVLLGLNTAVFVYTGTPSEGLDSAAWLILLVLFEIETGSGPMPPRRTAMVHALRLLAAVAIPVAAVGYVIDSEWVDAINAVVWIAVVLMLEFQVRFPRAAADYRVVINVVATGLYVSLGCVVLVWLWRADWFSAYDGFVWLLAFATIEINVLHGLRRPAPRHGKNLFHI